jgi:hypothetical protein
MSESAMILTQAQWDDMAAVCRMYLRNTAWVHGSHKEDPKAVERVLERRALCDRVVDACEP